MNFPNNTVSQITKGVKFYADLYDRETFYARFEILGGVKKLAKISGRYFQAFIRQRIRKLNAGNYKYKAVLDYLEDHFLIEESPPQIETHTRTAGNLRKKDGKPPVLEYDLNNDKQQVIQVTPDGWQITDEPIHDFVTHKHMLAQVTPEKSDIDLFMIIGKYANISGDTLVLLVAWLVQSFSHGNHSLLIIAAERGSGKSSLSRLIRRVLSPSTLDITAYPSKLESLQTTLTNSYLAIFDNLAGDISREESALMCSAITRGVVAKRTLYTTDDMYVQKIHNVLVLNGVSIVPREADLAERSILIKLKKLPSNKLRTEHDLWGELEKDLPSILGGIFSALSSAMNIVETLYNEPLHRMADSYIEMMAVAVALGIEKSEFERIYDDNIALLEKERANTPLIEAVVEFMNSPAVIGRKASGTVAQIYAQVKNCYSGDKRLLPGSPSSFSQKLKSDRQTLERAGYTICLDDTFCDATHLTIIKNKQSS